MERIVYLLGAGFSAPLGLPVMSNFLEKSKDLYFSDPQRYRYFEDVLNAIAKMSVVKNYYSTDLFNIEEILSVLAMQQNLRGRRLKKAFLAYIADVISYYTPIFLPTENLPSNWQDRIFASAGHPGSLYGAFVANLIQLRVSPAEIEGMFRASSFQESDAIYVQESDATYGIITLNYDLILERFLDYIETAFVNTGILRFASNCLDGGVPLAKLHGSVDTGIMVAPTWNKTLARNLLPAWKTAFQLLAKANHIRIIGYSLPTADAYIKYLLRAAAIESPHLKKIDVLCRDDRKGSVRARYEEFIDFANFRFVNGNVVDYLRPNVFTRIQRADSRELRAIEFRGLEAGHEHFFSTQAS
ncbi:MAG TPA: SIR2 family protein [Thermoanaerobaculia bacterium]